MGNKFASFFAPILHIKHSTDYSLSLTPSQMSILLCIVFHFGNMLRKWHQKRGDIHLTYFVNNWITGKFFFKHFYLLKLRNIFETVYPQLRDSSYNMKIVFDFDMGSIFPFKRDRKKSFFIIFAFICS